MKRIFAFMLACVMLSFCLLPTVFAAESEKGEADKLKDSAAFTCVYNEEKKQIVIEGTVKHDVMLDHRDHTIKVYSFAAGKTYEEFATEADKVALASAEMSIKFAFHIDALSISERFAKYVLVFCSPEGEEYLVGQPMLPSVASNFKFSQSDRTGYKGILIDDATELDVSGAGTVIIDIDLDNAFADSSDIIIYPINNTSIRFGRDFVEEIDQKVSSAYVSGARIYLRLLTSASNADMAAAYNENDSRYTLPDLYSEDTLNNVYACARFFSERYTVDDTRISGVILGDKIDDVVNTNYVSTMTPDEYADLYVFYLVVVANAMRTVNNSLDIVIPISDKNDYADGADTGVWGVDSTLERILSKLDSGVSGTFPCSVMVRSEYVPFGLSNHNIGKNVDLSNIDKGVISAANIDVFTSYLLKLSRTYKSAPTNVIYSWQPPSTLRGNALSSAYAYNYYKLYDALKVSCFVLDVDSKARDAYNGISDLVRRIDTNNGSSYTSGLPEYFGKSSWTEVLGKKISASPTFELFESNMTSKKVGGLVGEFLYLDFSNSSALKLIHKGGNAESIRYEYDGIDTRAIKVTSGALDKGESFGCIGVYEYRENYNYTHVMSVRLRVDGLSDDALYEITLTLGSGKDRIVAKGVVGDEEMTTLYFDIESYASSYTAETLRISVRCLTDETEECDLWLYGLSGYSEEYSSTELAELIETQRNIIKNTDKDADNSWNSGMIFTVLGITIAVIAVGIGLFMVFKKEDTKNKE